MKAGAAQKGQSLQVCILKHLFIYLFICHLVSKMRKPKQFNIWDNILVLYDAIKKTKQTERRVNGWLTACCTALKWHQNQCWEPMWLVRLAYLWKCDCAKESPRCMLATFSVLTGLLKGMSELTALKLLKSWTPTSRAAASRMAPTSSSLVTGMFSIGIMTNNTSYIGVYNRQLRFTYFWD